MSSKLTQADLIKLMVKGDNQAQFTRYVNNELWYEVHYVVPDPSGNPEEANYEVFEFPVPTSDIGGATFQAGEKAMLLMRYIRKHLKMLEEAKAAQAVQNPAP